VWVWTGEGLGSGQTWRDVTGSRASNVTYTNVTGKPITVIAGVVAGTVCEVMASINDGAWLVVGISSIPSGTSYCNGHFVVQPGATYAINPGGFGGPSLVWWYELR
jgi:hypothetical protein